MNNVFEVVANVPCTVATHQEFASTPFEVCIFENHNGDIDIDAQTM